MAEILHQTIINEAFDEFYEEHFPSPHPEKRVEDVIRRMCLASWNQALFWIIQRSKQPLNQSSEYGN